MKNIDKYINNILVKFTINTGADGNGVYLVCIYNRHTKREKILYIGSSKSIHKRIFNTNHPFRIIYDRLNNYDTPVYIRYLKVTNYRKLEKYLIKQLQPKFNKQCR